MSHTSWQDLALNVVAAILPVATLAISAVLYLAAAYLLRLTQRVQNRTAQEALQAAIHEALLVATDAVKATGQKWVNDLKQGRQDGKLTPDERRQALEDAKDYFLSHLSQQSLQILQAGIGPIQAWLDDFIEARLAELKANAIPKESAS